MPRNLTICLKHKGGFNAGMVELWSRLRLRIGKQCGAANVGVRLRIGKQCGGEHMSSHMESNVGSLAAEIRKSSFWLFYGHFCREFAPAVAFLDLGELEQVRAAPEPGAVHVCISALDSNAEPHTSSCSSALDSNAERSTRFIQEGGLCTWSGPCMHLRIGFQCGAVGGRARLRIEFQCEAEHQINPKVQF